MGDEQLEQPAATPADIADALDLARGELDDEDLAALEAAVDAVDFATRRASPERQARLDALVARLVDVAQQIKDGRRKPGPERGPLTAEEEARYQALVEEGVQAGERGNLELAQERLGAAVLLDPEGVVGLFNLGVVYGLLAHMNMAKAEFYDDRVRDESYAQRAQICYERVLEVEPEHLAALNNLATLYAMRDERDLATEVLNRMLTIEPKDDQDRRYLDAARRQLDELSSI